MRQTFIGSVFALVFLGAGATAANAATLQECSDLAGAGNMAEQAVTACTTVIAAGGTEADLSLAYQLRGYANIDLDLLDQALADETHALALDSANDDAYHERGYIHLLRDEYELAIQDMSAAIDIDDAQASHFSQRGMAYRLSGDYESSLSDLSRAIELLPEHADYYVGRGLSYDALGLDDEALADWTKAYELGDREDGLIDLLKERGAVK